MPAITIARTRLPAWLPAILLGAAALAYSNSLGGPFLFDDNRAILDNLQIRQLWPLSVPLSPRAESPVAARPVVNLSLAINYALGGFDVTGYHLWNIAIHLVCALLLFGVVRRTLMLPSLRGRFGAEAGPLALACSLIWVLHPLQTEVVDYVTQRSESMMSLCFLLTLYGSIRGWNTVAVLACAAGMACKESMVTAPIVVVLYDAVFVFGSLGKALRARRGLYLALAATWIVLAALIQTGPRANSVGFSTGVGVWTYLLNQPAMIMRYLWLAFWPAALVLDYGMTRPVTVAQMWPYATVIVALLLAALAALVRRPKAGFLAVVFFILLAPTSSFVPIATEVGAERRMYLALAAVIIGCVLLAHQTLQRVSPAAVRTRWAVAALLMVCAMATFGTMRRNAEYGSVLTMAEVTLARRPHGRTHGFLGEELLAAGRRDEAIAQFRAGAGDYPLARFALGQELFIDRKPEEAIAQLRTFITEAPTLVEVPHAHELIGRALFQQGKLDEAEQEFRTILRLTPEYAAAHERLGDTLNNQGRLDEAAAEYALFLRAVPDDFDALTRMGSAQSRSGHHDAAIRALSSAVDVQPDNATAHANLANALLNKQDLPAAEREARRAVELNPRDPVGFELFGLAVASQGRTKEAREYFEAALKIDPNYAPARDDLARLPR